ncbi:MAG: T9SS type A sorting domain-containing protein [Flavicella sp.]
MKKITFIMTVLISSLSFAQFSNDFTGVTEVKAPSDATTNEWFTWPNNAAQVSVDTTNEWAVLTPVDKNAVLNIKYTLDSGDYVIGFDIKRSAGTTAKPLSVFVRDNTQTIYQAVALNDNSGDGIINEASWSTPVYDTFRVLANNITETFKTYSFNTTVAPGSNGKTIMVSFSYDKDGGDLHFDNFSITEATLSSDAEGVAGLSVYPNPANDVIYISSASSVQTVSLVNALGQTVAAPFNGSSVDVAGLPNGVYILTVVAGGKSSAQKVVVE